MVTFFSRRSSECSMETAPVSPAGGYRRILVPQKGRPRSPEPAQLPGCVPGLVAPAANVFDFEAGGSPVHRRLRSTSPKTCDRDVSELRSAFGSDLCC